MIMSKNKQFLYIGLATLSLMYTACISPTLIKKENKTLPKSFTGENDSITIGKTKWKDFFTDPNLIALIDSALKKNQEFNIMLQEINISKNEVRARRGAYLPIAGVGIGSGIEKVGRYTSHGASDAAHDITPGKKVPDILPNYAVGISASWEVDIWNKLHNAKKAAVNRYLASVDGRNFMVTQLIAEIASSYYELVALDNQLEILTQNIDIYKNSLEIVKLEKQSARVTELAVRRFEAEVLKSQSRQFYIKQQITETENKINFLIGSFPQPVKRNSKTFNNLPLDSIREGVPSQLLENRPDIKQAERQLTAARLDIKAAKAEFYPALRITAGGGLGAFNPAYLLKTPESLIFSLAGDLIAPLINRNVIKANYYTAGSKQVQAVYNYERAILRAHIEVVNQLSNINNLQKSYELKSKQVEALNQSIEISNILFKSARADYMEVLLTQRDALESRFELVETKMKQMKARVEIYRALGGGWQ